MKEKKGRRKEEIKREEWKQTVFLQKFTEKNEKGKGEIKKGIGREGYEV